MEYIYKYIFHTIHPTGDAYFKTEVLKTGRYKKCRPALPTPDGCTINHQTAKSGGFAPPYYHTSDVESKEEQT